jgi:hypothetical protein
MIKTQICWQIRIVRYPPGSHERRGAGGACLA